MLILTRKDNQSIAIGNDPARPLATITVTRSLFGRVKLGIDAPGQRVRRSELPLLPLPLPGTGARAAPDPAGAGETLESSRGAAWMGFCGWQLLS